MFYKDLHGLRGIAVLLVCLFHFFEPIFPGGFRGVDIFFVLSGFLVTHSTLHSFEQASAKEFLIGFYSRRFARIFPSLILVSFFSLVVALAFTIPSEGKKVILDYWTANIGVFNIRQFNENLDYFNQSQSLNFFTQTWSLAVEEQFYVVFSLIFLVGLTFLKNKKYFIGLVLVLVIASFSANFFSIDSSGKFYLLKFRYWEIGFGVILYFISTAVKKLRGHWSLDYLALFLLIGNLFIPVNPNEFLLTSVITILPASYFILTKGEVRGFFNFKSLQLIATISYTLYLVHWPISVILNHIDNFHPLYGLMGLVISIGLSYLIYFKFEEKALHYFKRRPELSAKMLGAWILFCVSGFFVTQHFKFSSFYVFPNFAQYEVDNLIRDYRCYNTIKKHKDPYQACLDRGDASEVIYLLGDSHSAAITPAFEAMFGDKVRPLVLKATGTGYDGDIFRNYSFYKENERIGIFEYILEHSRPGDSVFIVLAQDKLGTDPESLKGLAKLYSKYFSQYHAKGVQVILFKDLPYFKYKSIYECAFHEFALGNLKKCDVPLKDVISYRDSFESFYKDVSHVSYHLDLFDIFCHEGVCSPYVNGTFTLFDNNHLTTKGSLELVGDLKRMLLEKGFDPELFVGK